jgi:hypothetical protein
MFFKNKLLFFIIQFIFCTFLVYFINQQIVLIGFFDNFVIELMVLYFSIMFVSNLISQILIQLYFLCSKITNHHINKHFISWLYFTTICYLLTFFIFALAIEY